DIGMLLLVAVFQLLTVPVSGHMITRAAFRTGLVDRVEGVAELRGETLDGEDVDGEGASRENTWAGGGRWPPCRRAPDSGSASTARPSARPTRRARSAR